MKRRDVLGSLLVPLACTSTGGRVVETGSAESEPEPLPEPLPTEEHPRVVVDFPPQATVPPFRPLLILVAPKDEETAWMRGCGFGELLNHGTDASLAPLALFEVVCESYTTLRT